MILTSVPPQVFITNSSNLELRGRPSIKTIPLSNKPTHVLWTSTYRPEAHHICAWQEWCEINLFPYGRNSFLITPRKNLKVFCPLSSDMCNNAIGNIKYDNQQSRIAYKRRNLVFLLVGLFKNPMFFNIHFYSHYRNLLL